MSLNIRYLFWLLFGFLIFMPIEVGFDGLYLAYFLIVLLFFLTNKVSVEKVIVYSAYSLFVLISVALSNEISITTLVNPLVATILLIIGEVEKKHYEMIKRGIYLSAVTHSFLLLYLVLNTNINSLYQLMTDRTWAVDSIAYFGNGLAMMFAIAMVMAAKERKYKLFFIIFIGGVLTTSRIPILIFLVILFFHLVRYIKFRKFSHVFLALSLFASLVTVVGYNYSSIEALKGRFTQASDRVAVYSEAVESIAENPVWGVGSYKLPFYEHAHNSYLQVAYKFGLVAFLFWLTLIYLAYFRGLKVLKNTEFILFFLIVSSVQIGLQNPNLLVAITVYYYLFSQNGSQFKGRSIVPIRSTGVSV